MAANEFPLNEISIKKLYLSDDKVVYEIPIYQRNYAWEKNEIETLVTDVCDAFFCSKSNDKNYYIGTLVSYKKNDKVYEIIDGQQRLTTIRLILAALFSFGKDYKIKDFGTVFSSLTYRARKKSTDTLKHLPIAFSKEGCNSAVDFDSYECDAGLKNGFDSAVSVLKDKFNTLDENQDAFIDFLLNKVHIIHYVVPKDIDLNHYFEVMNSRGEQLEKHEIIKARLIEKIGNSAPDDNLNRLLLSKIWETCSDMYSYVQQNFAKIKLVKRSDIFGDNLNEFKPKDFDSIIPKNIVSTTVGNEFEENNEQLSLVKILEKSKDPLKETRDDVELKNKFLPVIDFPNFLLVVLKVTYLLIGNHKKLNSLDDKDLLDAFNDYFDSDAGENKIKLFIYNLLKCRFFLDNFIVHHTVDQESEDTNPWKVQIYWYESKKKNDNSKVQINSYPVNLIQNGYLQSKIVQLLSMFEVTYNAKQRKNYLVYCLYYLMKNYDTDTFGQKDYVDYVSFVENLAKQYFFDVYLNVEKLIDKEPKNEDDSLDIDKHDFEYKIYTSPRPGSFDEIIIPKLLNQDGYSNFGKCTKRSLSDFYNIYGDGISKYDTGFDSKILTHKSNGIPLFVFNYLDYLIWDCFKTNDNFWDTVGCTKFENDGNINFNIDNFYFSNTRKSLEHFYPQANAKGGDALNETQINCFGNFGMIGSEANSSGSNFEPYAKLKTYLSRSSKISRVSVSSLKFLIMMKICDSQNKDIPYEKKWFFDEIQEHQKKMLALLGLKNSDNERNDKKLCKDIMKKLLCELGTYLVEACKKKTQLNSECECDFSNLNDMIKEYYDSNKQSYPKVFVEIKRVEGIRILLNIEIESDLYYGICFTDDRWKNLSNQKDKILKAFDNDSWKNLVKKNNKDAPFWVWFRNLPSEEIHLNFRKCNEYYMNLLDETKYEEMKKRIIKEIDDNLDNILKFGVPKSLM